MTHRGLPGKKVVGGKYKPGIPVEPAAPAPFSWILGNNACAPRCLGMAIEAPPSGMFNPGYMPVANPGVGLGPGCYAFEILKSLKTRMVDTTLYRPWATPWEKY